MVNNENCYQPIDKPVNNELHKLLFDTSVSGYILYLYIYPKKAVKYSGT